jgi:hypothetical protein
MKMLSNRTGGFLPALILAVMLVLGLTAQKAQAQDYYDDYGNGDYQEFYDDLSPYGQWLNDPQYGYVWTPNVGGDFRPYYTNGRWAMTEYGNTWVSDYNWGWAPFHYGRWAQSSYYGWIWIPGNEWGPAWVNWRQGGGYYGWAPMGPGISINISFGGGYNVPNPWWTFIPCGNIYTPGWQRYYSPRRTVNIINNTTIINNTYVDNRTRNTYVTGPRRTEIEAVTRQRVNVYNVSNRTRAGATNISGRSVQVYRPNVERTSARGTQVNAAPRQAKTLERSAVTNTGGGRAPSRPAATQQQNSRIDRAGQMREAQRGQQNVQQRAQQERIQQGTRQRDVQIQRDQQVQQQRVQRDQQMQRVQQAEQQRNTQMQQQRMQRDQQQQRVQQAEQQRNVQMQREQQVQQQRVQRDQQVQQQRVQQAEQQRNVQMQREQQMQQRQQMQQQRNVERAQPQPQRIERSAPAPQQQRIERSAPEPQQRNVERSSRGR